MAGAGILSHLAITISYCFYAIAIIHIPRANNETKLPTVWIGNIIENIKHFDLGAIVMACCALVPLLIYIFTLITVQKTKREFIWQIRGNRCSYALAAIGAILAFGITTGEAMTTFGMGQTLSLHADFGPAFWIPPLCFWPSLASSMVIKTQLIKLQQAGI
jgi:hypothetical protein